MEKTEIMTFIEQAEARVNRELGKIDMRLGEIPDVRIGAIAGAATDFLRDNGVPVKGYVVAIRMVLSPASGSGEDAAIDIDDRSSHEEREAALRAAIERFQAAHGSPPRQTMEHAIRFLVD